LEGLEGFPASIEFSTPEYFLIAGAAVLLLIFIPWGRRKKRGLSIDLDYWKPHIASESRRVWVMSIPVIVISLLLAGALATPQLITKASTLIVGKPVMVVIDYSGSTSAATEFHPEETMQEAAQRVFSNLVELRADINFGLMIYARENYVARYFTYKNELFTDTLENWDVLMRVSQQTQTADALAAANRFMSNNIGGEDKAIILISDLDYNANDLPEIEENIDAILANGIKLYIISTTGNEETMVKMPQPDGVTVMSSYDAESINEMYNELTAMQTSSIRTDESLVKTSLMPVVMPPVLGIFLLCLILGETRFRKVP
jgi:hypothetical protein